MLCWDGLSILPQCLRLDGEFPRNEVTRFGRQSKTTCLRMKHLADVDFCRADIADPKKQEMATMMGSTGCTGGKGLKIGPCGAGQGANIGFDQSPS